jgi:prophage regulatory protein
MREGAMETTAVLVRMPAVKTITGLGRSTIYRLVKERKFPAPVKLSERSVAWRVEELGRWCDARERATEVK